MLYLRKKGKGTKKEKDEQKEKEGFEKRKKRKTKKSKPKYFKSPTTCESNLDCQSYSDCLSTSYENGECSVTYESYTVCTSNNSFQKDAKVNITINDYSRETMYIIEDLDKNITIIASSLFYNETTLFSITKYFKLGHYEFTIQDSYGDGIYCINGKGYYMLEVEGNLKASGDEFIHEEEWYFSISEYEVSIDYLTRNDCIIERCN